jgi:hypothetical protein
MTPIQDIVMSGFLSLEECDQVGVGAASTPLPDSPTLAANVAGHPFVPPPDKATKAELRNQILDLQTRQSCFEKSLSEKLDRLFLLFSQGGPPAPVLPGAATPVLPSSPSPSLPATAGSEEKSYCATAKQGLSISRRRLDVLACLPKLLSDDIQTWVKKLDGCRAVLLAEGLDETFAKFCLHQYLEEVSADRVAAAPVKAVARELASYIADATDISECVRLLTEAYVISESNLLQSGIARMANFSFAPEAGIRHHFALFDKFLLTREGAAVRSELSELAIVNSFFHALPFKGAIRLGLWNAVSSTVDTWAGFRSKCLAHFPASGMTEPLPSVRITSQDHSRNKSDRRCKICQQKSHYKSDCRRAPPLDAGKVYCLACKGIFAYKDPHLNNCKAERKPWPGISK